MTPPDLGAGQRERGRTAALAARRNRSLLKSRLREGSIVGADVVRLAGADSAIGRAAARMTIGELLLSIPGVGPVTADRALVAAGVSGRRRLSALGPHQLEQLSAVLE